MIAPVAGSNPAAARAFRYSSIFDASTVLVLIEQVRQQMRAGRARALEGLRVAGDRDPHRQLRLHGPRKNLHAARGCAGAVGPPRTSRRATGAARRRSSRTRGRGASRSVRERTRSRPGSSRTRTTARRARSRGCRRPTTPRRCERDDEAGRRRCRRSAGSCGCTSRARRAGPPGWDTGRRIS